MKDEAVNGSVVPACGVRSVFTLPVVGDFDLRCVPFPIPRSLWSRRVPGARCSLCTEQLGVALPVFIVPVLFVELIRRLSPHLNILLFGVSV